MLGMLHTHMQRTSGQSVCEKVASPQLRACHHSCHAVSDILCEQGKHSCSPLCTHESERNGLTMSRSCYRLPPSVSDRYFGCKCRPLECAGKGSRADDGRGCGTWSWRQAVVPHSLSIPWSILLVTLLRLCFSLPSSR